MKDTDVAYAAGFLDGEGCFTIKSNERGYFYIEISAGQVDPLPLMKLSAMFGGAVSVKNPARGPHALAYIWRISGKKAALVLRAIRQYLTVKGECADVLLEFQGGVKTSENYGARNTSDEEYARKLELKTKITLLNARGVPRGVIGKLLA